MQSLLRRIGQICLIALVLNTTALFAQEEITAVGSGIVAPIVEAAAEASEAAVTVNVSGTDRGLTAFCQGEADLALATRPLSTDEEFNCTIAGVEYLELLAGYNAIALISSADAAYNQCLTSDGLRTLLAPSAQGQVNDWSQVSATNPSSPLSLYIPAETSPIYAALDALVDGVGIRSDVQTTASDDDTISAVSSDPNALGVVSYASAAAAGDSVRALQINAGNVGCFSPSLETIEGREYTGADRLFVYVNSASLSKPGLSDLLNAIFSEDAQSTIEALNLAAPSADTTAANQQIITENRLGRSFSRDMDAFTIPANLIGALSVGGSPILNDLLQNVTATFTAQQPGVTLDQSYRGEPEGIRRLCSGELDIAVAYSDLTAEQTESCAANNVTTLPVELGSQVVVLVANAQSDFLTCLTSEQVAAAWSASSADTVTTWNQVSDEFPETPVTLFAPDAGSSTTDLLMFAATGAATPARIDVNLDNDVIYRAAATANVEGGLTYMSWAEYQTVAQSGQEGITLVAIDGGNGCVEPSAETFAAGEYPLVRRAHLLVNRASLARPEVQSLLWFVVSDENYAFISSAGLVGVSFADLEDVRFELQDAFEQAQAEAAQIAAESTPEATDEPTGDADEATLEATEAAE